MLRLDSYERGTNWLALKGIERGRDAIQSMARKGGQFPFACTVKAVSHVSAD